MSAPMFPDDVLFLQRFLKCCGYDPGPLDGVYGARTDRAFDEFESAAQQIAEQHCRFDRTSERHIASLQPRAQAAARRFLARVRDAGIEARVISGTRTYAEQNALFRRGRFGNPPPVVTKARGGQSNHNFGIAWDIGIFRNGAYQGVTPLYRKAAEVGLEPGLEWGGNWRTFQDEPHYELSCNHRITAVRTNFESGVAFV